MKKYLPVILIFRDKFIDCRGASELTIPVIYIRKGRVLTLVNVSATDPFRLTIKRILAINGDIRVAKKPMEMTAAEFKQRMSNEKKHDA